MCSRTPVLAPRLRMNMYVYILRRVNAPKIINTTYLNVSMTGNSFLRRVLDLVPKYEYLHWLTSYTQFCLPIRFGKIDLLVISSSSSPLPISNAFGNIYRREEITRKSLKIYSSTNIR